MNFGERVALDLSDLMINLENTTKLGVIGANGAGKSTFINAILDEVTYQGEVSKGYAEQDVTVVFQDNAYNELLKVGEVIRLVTGYSKQMLVTSTLVSDFQLAPLLNYYVVNLSGGERQRLTLALSMYIPKKLYLLDELTSGLDAEKRSQILQQVKRHTKEKAAIQITHYLEELENWATDLLVLDQGHSVFYGSVKAFEKKYSHYSQIITENIQLNLSVNAYLFEQEMYFYPQTHDEHERLLAEFLKKNINYSASFQSIKTTYDYLTSQKRRTNGL
ncbi:MAG: ATP-binding cassette domain-containing protein [Streptococcaceae bacterium]|nr:ATP-binding cassette domain-containing protein [Streptococcaceae bacterium]